MRRWRTIPVSLTALLATAVLTIREQTVASTHLPLLAQAVGASSTGSQDGSVSQPSGDGLVGKVIVVDAGHGGPDGGAQAAHGLLEKNVALQIAQKVTDYLQQAGAIVYMTRTTDTDFSTAADRRANRRHQGDLRHRLQAILARNPDMVLSVHCNAVPSPTWSGAHTIYMTGSADGKRLATLIQQEFRKNLLPTRRLADDMDTLYLLKRIPVPTALAEVGFLSNPLEAAHLATSHYQDCVAISLYLGVIRYFDERPRETPHDDVWAAPSGPNSMS